MPPVPRSTLAGYAILAVLVVILGGRWLAHRDGAGGVAAPASGALPASAVRVTRSPSAPAVVDVAGAVRRPGVYRLAAGSRVRDALARAGGLTHAAAPGAVNLAAKLADGQQIVIPRAAPAAACGGTAGAAAPAAPPAGPVSLAGATVEQLDTLPGVGPATAQKILDWRTQHGGFTSVDDLGEVPGIGPKKLATLRPLVQP